MTGESLPEEALPGHSRTTALSDSPSRAGLLGVVRGFARPHRGAITAAVLLGAAASSATALQPVVIGRITDALLGDDAHRALLLAAIGIVLAVAQTLLAVWARIRLTRAGEHVVRDVRDDVARRLATAGMPFIRGHRPGELIQRATEEIAELSAFIRETLTNLLVTGSTVVLFLVVLSTQSLALTGTLLVVFLPPAVVVMARFRTRAPAAYGAMAQAEANVAAELAEDIRVRELLVQAPARTSRRAAARFAAVSAAAVGAQLRTAVVGRWINAMTLVEGSALVVLVVVGSALVRSGSVSPGVVVTFVLASVTLFSAFSDLVELVGSVEEAATGAARVQELRQAAGGTAAGSVAARGTLRSVPASARPAADPAEDPRVIVGDPAVEVEDLWFGYHDTPVLRGVTFRIGRGERCGIAGRSGEGKSTLATLVAGFQHADSGSIRCHGVDPATLGPGERARLVSYVPQEVVLGAGTLADELRLADPSADDGMLRDLVASLGLGPWFATLPDGLGTSLADDGSMSAGERQLIGIARAALSRSAVVVLDEVTSDIDPRTAALVEEALAAIAGERTIIVIAHRPATLRRMDVVYELAAGQVRERARP